MNSLVSLRTSTCILVILGCTFLCASFTWAEEDIPVTFRSTQILDVVRPTIITVQKNSDLYRQTIEEFEKNKQQHEGASDEIVLQQLLADPIRFVAHNEQHKKVVKQFQQDVLAKKSQWLKKSEPFETVFRAAQMLAVFNDRSGFDAVMTRLEYPKNDEVGRLCYEAYSFPGEWLAESEGYKTTMRSLLTDPDRREWACNGLLRIGETQPAIDFWFEQYAAHPTEIIYRGSALKSLCNYAPSDRVLGMVEETLTDPIALNYYDGPDILASFFDSSNPNWQQRALGLCEKLAVGKPGFRYHYLLCQQGGPEFADYFETHVRDEKCSYSMNALLRNFSGDRYLDLAKEMGFDGLVVEHAGENAIPYLQQRLQKKPSWVTCLRLAKRLTALLDGRPNSDSETVLRKVLPKVHDYLSARSMIEQMVLMGATDGEQLKKHLPQPRYNSENSDKWWQVHNVTPASFVEFLNSTGCGKSITVDLAYQQSMFAEKPTRPRGFASLAMQAAGVGQEFEIDMHPFKALPYLTAAFCRLTDGEFVPEGVSLVGVEKLRIAWDDRVFEFPVDENNTWYDPVTLTDVLNTLVEKYGHTSKRFYVFQSDLSSLFVHVAFLEPPLAKQLVEKFHLVAHKSTDE